MPDIEIKSEEWCRNNPAEAARRLFLYQLTFNSARKLLKTGDAMDRHEAITWLNGAIS